MDNHESSRYTNNHNVEFETISSHSNTHSKKLLGKRGYGVQGSAFNYIPPNNEASQLTNKSQKNK